MRIVLKRWKFAYLAGGYVALVIIARVTDPLPLPVYYAIDYALFFAYLIFAVRAFRGKDEPIEPPRPWWRLTAKPKAGFWLAAFFAFGATAFVVPDPNTMPRQYEIGHLVQSFVVAVLYLNSSIQLLRRARTRAPVDEKFTGQTFSDQQRYM